MSLDPPFLGSNVIFDESFHSTGRGTVRRLVVLQDPNCGHRTETSGQGMGV